MGCSTTIVKYSVLFFNFVFATAGGGLMALGILQKLKNDDIHSFIPDKYHLSAPAFFLIVLGAIIFSTALFGCFGAFKENTCILIAFSVILILLLLTQIAIGVYAFIQVGDADEMKASVTESIEASFNGYPTQDVKNQKRFDFLQTFLQCCGVTGPDDWKWESGRLPASCCNDNANCTVASANRYQIGCAEKTYTWFKNGLDILGILAISLSFIEVLILRICILQIIGTVFAICLASSIKNQERRNAYA